MKKTFSLLFTLLGFCSVFCISCTKNKSDRNNEVVVYSYDSFVDEWGPGPALTELFKEKTGKTLTLVSVGDGANLIRKAISEKKYPVADVICGMDNNMLSQLINSGIAEAYSSANKTKLFEELLIDESDTFTPYDYSYFTLIWNSESDLPAPQSLEDLTKDIYKKKIILMNPKTSTPGLGFVTWAMAVYQDNFESYWERLKPSILTMAPSWSTGYGLFTNGEAPLVCSYTTSPAYHVEYDETDKFKALIFEHGHIMQIEGASLLKAAPNKEGGKEFIDFLTSDEAQAILPKTQWMYPANKNVQLPECFNAAPKAEKVLPSPSNTAIEKVESLTF